MVRPLICTDGVEVMGVVGVYHTCSALQCMKF